jgi:hypothetical protein
MHIRTFHQLETESTGLDIFYKWANSPKKPINPTDVSLIFEGKEYIDKQLDYIAFGNVLTPCLTADNLISCIRSMDGNQKQKLRRALLEVLD